MADTSLIFNVLVKDKASAAFNRLKGAAQSVGDTVAKSLRRGDSGHLVTEIEKSRVKIRELAEEFDRTGNKNLFKDMRRERSNLSQLERALGEVGTSGFRQFSTGAQNAMSAATNLGTNLWNLIPALAMLAAASVVAGPAVGLLGSALGAIPAVLTGVGFSVGALGLGFMGLSDAFKKSSSAGQSVAAGARQIAQAERAVRDAQRQTLAAQLALNRAREDAARRMRDQSLSLRVAQHDETQAVLDLHAAEIAIEEARHSGTIEDIDQARSAYERQKLAIEEARNRTIDLQAATAENARTGVEGSEEVTQAKERQRQAEEQLADATAQLAETQRQQAQAASAAADEVMRLAPAAQQVVDVIKSLKPAFDDLRLDVQERLFSGLGNTLQMVATAWLPTLRTELGAYAGTFNGLMKTFGQTISTPTFIDNIASASKTARENLDKIGQSVAGPLTAAFGQVSAASKPLIDALGDGVSGLVTDFATWIDKANQSGELKDFFDKAGKFMREVFDTGKDVGEILATIAGIAFDSKNPNGSAWDSFRDVIKDIKVWLDDEENQQKLREWIWAIEELGRLFLWTAGAVATAVGWFDRVEYNIEQVANSVGDFFTKSIPKTWDGFVKWLEGLPGRISKATSGMWNSLSASFKAAVNDIIGGWNRLKFGISGGSFFGINFPSFALDTPDIPYLARGGDVQRGGSAIVGERGPELVSLSAGARVTPLTGSAAQGDRVVRVELEWVGDGGDEFFRFLRKGIRVRGGAKTALGT